MPVATTAPPTSHSVEDTLPSESVAVAETATVSPAFPSVSVILLLPPEIETLGDAFGALTDIVTVAVELSPLLSVALKVTEFVPSLNERFADVPVATTEPSISHSSDVTLPSESDDTAEIDTISPALPSVSETLRSPPEMETDGGIFAAATVIVTLVLELAPSPSVARKVTVVAPSSSERFAEVPVATTAPPTSHSVEDTFPSESVAVAETATVSPASPSVSGRLLSPPEITTTGA